MEAIRFEEKIMGLVWVKSYFPVLPSLLEQILESEARAHRGHKPPAETAASLVVICASNEQDVVRELRHLEELDIEAPTLVFGPRIDVGLARAALRGGARGFVHAGMPSEQVARALSLAQRGEVVLPRDLLEVWVAGEAYPDLSVLKPRQLEILELVAGGLPNAQIAKRVFLSESTVKQYLRTAYKTLGVKNRTEATRIWRLNNPARVAS